MENSKKDVEGEQSDSPQNELKKGTTDPYMNKKPVVGKARARARGVSGTKNSNRPKIAAGTALEANI